MEKAVCAISRRKRRFLEYEDECWKKQIEVEEKRQKEDREHELRTLQMLGQAFRRDNHYEFNTAGHYEYDF